MMCRNYLGGLALAILVACALSWVDPVGAQTTIACRQNTHGGYPWAVGDCLNANDLNDVLTRALAPPAPGSISPAMLQTKNVTINGRSFDLGSSVSAADLGLLSKNNNGTDFASLTQTLTNLSGMPVKDNAAAVANTATTAYKALVRRGFATPGDGPQTMYYATGQACTINSGAGDNGAEIRSFIDGLCWKAIFPAGGASARVWGSTDNAVPGPLGAACSGITGTDNVATAAAAINWAFANRGHLVFDGQGTYRFNGRLNIQAPWVDPEPYNDNNLRHPVIDFRANVVTCGDDVGIYLHPVGLDSLVVHVRSLVGPGAQTSLQAAYAGHENIGILIEGASATLIAEFVSDYNLNIVAQNGFSHKLYLGTLEACYGGLLVRNGPGGMLEGAGDITVNYQRIGGPYTFNGDPDFPNRQARSCYWGIQTEGSGQFNEFNGGTVEYNVKGPTPTNIINHQDWNKFNTWVEGQTGAGGLNVSNDGNNNTFNLGDMATPSDNVVNNVLMNGGGNRVNGPYALDNTYGINTYAAGNYANGAATPGTMSNTVTCSVGVTPPAYTINNSYWTIDGTKVWTFLDITLNTVNDCSGELLIAGLPFQVATDKTITTMGRNLTSQTADQCIFHPGTTTLGIMNVAGTFTPVNGTRLVCTGLYETQ